MMILLARRIVASGVALLVGAILIAGCGAGADDAGQGEGKVSPRFQKLQDAKAKAEASKR